MTILYRKHVSGIIGTWRIYGDPVTGLITIRHAAVIGGSEVEHQEQVTTNLSGRSLSEQVELRVRSRVGRMLDRGYKRTLHDAREDTSNQLGLKRPMLAQSLNKVKRIDYAGAVLQKKLDGHRCLITKHDGEIVAYSRQGKYITSVPHILEPLKDLPDGMTLDGELYKHGVPLQTLASWIKRSQPESKSLMYVVYDTVSNEPYRDRLGELQDYLRDKPKHIPLLRGRPFENTDNMWAYHREAVLAGFEGLILRTNDRGYEDGARSQSLIKIKRFHEMEVLVTGITASKEGWAVLHCKTPDNPTGANCDVQGDRTFRCSAPGTMEEKRRILRESDKYIGRQLTIQYSVLTNDDIPFHPVALRWREDI